MADLFTVSAAGHGAPHNSGERDRSVTADYSAADLLLPMDWPCLGYLLSCDKPVDLDAIPSKLFDGEIPEGHPDLVDLGFVKHVGKGVQITAAGRALFVNRRAA